MKEIKPYCIFFAKNENLVKAMKFLLSKGLVFTNRDRIKSWEVIIDTYTDNSKWRWIYICHDKECMKVMNTSQHLYRLYYSTRISYKDFVKEVLPQL
jgi:hypothetical protein